jgi:hypothetical protein
LASWPQGTSQTYRVPARAGEQRYVDAQLDAQDAKDRQQLIMEKANEQAMLKVAKESE